MPKNSSLPNIYAYNDFRKFIADYQKARHAIDKSFTKTEFCKLLGIPNARSYINDIISPERKRKLTPNFVELFIRTLKFDAKEALFFRCLVNFNQAVYPDERDLYFDQLISLNRTPTRKLDKLAYTYYKEWYHGVIRALLEIQDFGEDGDYAALARMVYPHIKETQARQSIVLLKELQLIAKNEHGFYKPTEKCLATDTFLQNEMVKNYQIRCLQLAEKAIIQNTKLPQSVTSRTISVSLEGYKRIEKQIGKFSSEIRSTVHKDESAPDRVCHLDILLFPVSQISEAGEGRI
ncbi:MAG: TIGR02147 family protein [Fibrobacteria bacterium]|nr:TIGR02147 family protein [Fibrobacteria bacterium]